MGRIEDRDWPVGVMAIGVTGHRGDNPAMASGGARIAAVIGDILDRIAAAARAQGSAFREGGAGLAMGLVCPLADGADAMAAEAAWARGWPVVAPLPFGVALTAALTAHGVTRPETARALASGAARAGEAGVTEAALAAMQGFRDRAARAHVFALAERDAALLERWAAALAAAEPSDRLRRFQDLCSQRYALASRIVVERCDILIGVWDGESRASAGGTGHTIEMSLNDGVPVVWIDPAQPETWRVVERLSELDRRDAREDEAGRLARIVAAIAVPGDPEKPATRFALRGQAAFRRQRVRSRGAPWWSLYRVVEWSLGGSQGGKRTALWPRLADPARFAEAAWGRVIAQARTLAPDDPDFAARIATVAARRFARADAIATQLSDVYRGGMVANFALAWLAVTLGAVAGPAAEGVWGWRLLGVELALLVAIIALTWSGRSLFHWHTRWLESRRVAEYLRHAHVMGLAGVTRPIGVWPGATGDEWPEWYARQSVRELGLPRAVVTAEYLGQLVGEIAARHVGEQRRYHEAKAARLHAVDRGLERLGLAVFVLSAVYLGARVAGYAEWAAPFGLGLVSVAGPMLAATLGGIRYFCDFDRFAEISAAAARRFAEIEAEIAAFDGAGARALDYEAASRLFRRIDDAVVAELESWQSIFGQKGLMMPA